MFETKKDFETTYPSLSKSTISNDVLDTLTSKDINSVSQINENLNEKVKDFYTFDERIPKEIEWLWKPYIVKGNINIIMGDGGLGKSYLITWLVSAISKGAKIPFSNNNFKQGTSILQNAEDDPDTTILPRLMLNDVDVSKIGAFNEENEFLEVQQIKRLEDRIKEFHPEVVVLDPIQSFVGNININSQNEVKNALKPLKQLAQKYNCAIIMIMHLNKNNAAKASQRANGSTEFITSSRSVILITENPENSSERLFIPVKTNLMKEGEKNTLSFKINDKGVIEWIDNKGKVNADIILSPFETQDVLQSITKGFIIGALSRGDIYSNDFKDLALKNGIKEKMYNITKATMKKEKIIDDYQKDKKYYWTLVKGGKKDE